MTKTFKCFFSKSSSRKRSHKAQIAGLFQTTYNTSLLQKEGGSLRDTYLVIKMDSFMFCQRTEVQDRSAHTQRHQQAQFTPDVQLQPELAQPPSWAWCSGACLATFTNRHVKVLLHAHILQPVISKASCAQARVQLQDLCFFCWQWQQHFIISLTIGKKHRRWWGHNDSSMDKAWQLIL